MSPDDGGQRRRTLRAGVHDRAETRALANLTPSMTSMDSALALPSSMVAMIPSESAASPLIYPFSMVTEAQASGIDSLSSMPTP